MKRGTIIFILSLYLILIGMNVQGSNAQSAGDDNVVPPSQEGGFDLRNWIITNLGDTNKYFFEFMIVIILVIYVINYFLGKRLNEKYALLWVQENRKLFESEFSHVGVSNIQGGALLDSESANSFKFYASGRQNCVYALTTMELKKRQDLLSMMIFNFIWPERDRLRIEIPIDTGAPLPFIFAVAKRKEAKNISENYPDIKNFCRKMTFDELGKQYVVFGESEETSEFILSGPVVSVLKKHENVIEMLSFSDLKQPYKQFLRVDMNIPHAYLKDPKEFQNIVKMILYLVDHLTHYKMSQAIRSKAEKERQVYENTKAKEKQKEKNEEIQKKLQEKKQAEASSKKKDEKKEEQKYKKKMQRKFVKMV